MQSKILAITVALVLGLSINAALADPMPAEIISISNGNNFTAVLDGYPNGQTVNNSPNVHGSAGNGNNWGVYQQYGWLHTAWQSLDADGSQYDGDYIWFDNFNVMKAIWGSDYLTNYANQVAVDLGLHNVDNAFPNIEVHLMDKDSGGPQNAGLISDRELTPEGSLYYDHPSNDNKDEYGLLKLTGSFDLTSIFFGNWGPETNSHDPWRKHGSITLNGLLTLGNEVFNISWTLIDHSNGNPSVISLLNGVNSDVQIELNNGVGVAATPEPDTMLLFGTGLLGMTWLRRRKSLKAKAAKS